MAPAASAATETTAATNGAAPPAPAESTTPTTPETPAKPAAPADDVREQRRSAFRQIQQAEEAKAKLRQEQQALEAMRAEVAKERQEAQALLEQAKADPWGFFERTGITAEELAANITRGADPHAKKITELAKQVEETKGELQKRDERAAAERREAEDARALTAFVGHVTSDEGSEKYPTLVQEYSPRQIAERTRQVAEAFFKKRGYAAQGADIAEFLEEEAKQIRAEREERASRLAKKKTAPPEIKAPDTTTQVNGTSESKPKVGPVTRTITNVHASQTASAAVSKTKGDRRAEAIRVLEQMQARKA